MSIDDTLRHELREVADGLSIPAMPQLPAKRPHTGRPWAPLLVAAAAVLVVLGAIALATSLRDDAAPSPIQPPDVRPLTRDVPTVPYVAGNALYVGGERVDGKWWEVNRAGDAWVALRDDSTMHWGTDAEPHAIPGRVIRRAKLSPDGALLAVSSTADGGRILVIDTESGETVNTLSNDSGRADPLGAVAVTDDAQVYLESDTESLLWLAADGDETVDLSTTVPQQQIMNATAAGLIVFDRTREGQRDAFYLAQPSDTGELSLVRGLPIPEVVVNPSGSWVAYGGSWGGESKTISAITALRVDGQRRLRLPPPDDRQLLAMTWEDDGLLLAGLYDDGNRTGLARCSVREQRCVVIDLP